MIPFIKKLPGSYPEAKRAGFNARHGFLTIRIHWDLPYAPAIMGQEVFEWWFKKQWNSLISSPLWLLFGWFVLTGSPVQIFSTGLAAFAVLVLAFDFIPSLQRRMELIGKNIEVIIASQRMGSNKDVHRASEIRSLQGYEQFKGWSETDIAAAFDDRQVDGLEWVRKNDQKITRWISEHSASH